MTISIDIPNDIAIDIDKLSKMATEYVQHHIYMLQETKKKQSHDIRAKKADAFRSLRGCISSNMDYKSMIEEALTEKYKIFQKIL